MEYQNAWEQVRHPSIDMRHHFSQEMKSNLLSSTHMGCVPKGQTVGGFRVKLESPRDVLQGIDWIGLADVKDRQYERISPEVEAGGWLRDEPVDFATSGSILHSGASGSTGDCGEGSMKIGESSFLSEASVSPPLSPSQERDAADDAATQPSRPSTSSSVGYAQLRAKLRDTKVRESVIRDAIERQGGGQKGLRAVIGMILFWVKEANRFTSRSNGTDSNLTEVIDELVLNNTGSANRLDAQLQGAGSGFTLENFNSLLQQDGNHILSSVSAFRDGGGSVCDLKIGGSSNGEFGELREFEMQGLGALDASTMPSDCWVPSELASESLRSAITCKLPQSPGPNGLLRSPDISCDESSSHQNKIRRLSPTHAGTSSSQSSNELPGYGCNGNPPAPDVFSTPGIFGSVGANPFAPGGPFSLSPSSPQPMDPQSLDSGSFNSFGLQVPILMEGNLGLGAPERGLSDRTGPLGSVYSPDRSLEPEHSAGPSSGVLAKAKASPSASTRLARKNRMDRNRKVASHHATRAAALAGQVGAVGGGSSGAAWPFTSSRSLRRMLQSRACPSAEGLVNAKDRREQENLQFLLQKILRPSDVGNLGRIVLPKKDAESHLPWLGAREGVKFACEDYDTGEKIMLRYRFWPNNKSRMYLLENTGDFVKKHQLQESDRLLIYRNQQRGTYIIRGRKGRDCVDDVSSQVQVEEKDSEGKDMSQQSCLRRPGPCNSGSSSNDRDVEAAEEVVASCLETASEPVATTVTAIATPQDDLLDFTDLPDAPMGDGAEALVRFPSLEAFDVEMLELVEVSAEKPVAKSS